MFLYNDPKLKQRRRDLRREQTKEEKALWNILRGQKQGHKFFRQYSVGPYILDFYCPKKRLGVELDGEHHSEDREYDALRDDYLVLNEIKVLRFWNKEVNDNIDAVLQRMNQELASS